VSLRRPAGNASEPKELARLNAEELACYENLCRSSRRLEQEHLPIEVLVLEIDRIAKSLDSESDV
jgi:hypothetical protein